MDQLKCVMGYQRNRRAFFTLESLLGILMLTVALSWVITAVMKASVVQDAFRQEDVALAHAGFVISNLKNTPVETLAQEIRQGSWNYPNAPSLSAAGIIPLPAESIITEVSGEGVLLVTVTVRWQNRNGETKTEVVTVKIGG